VSYKTSFDSKEPKQDVCFGCFASISKELVSDSVSIELKQTEEKETGKNGKRLTIKLADILKKN
jgi:hypothetical protein